MIATASQDEIQAFLDAHPAWRIAKGKLSRTFEFSDFSEAFGFMTEVALAAERSDHHPEWFNVYKKVVVDLTTHEAGGISTKDFALAKVMDRIEDRRK